MSELRHVQSFVAVDENGREYTLHKFTKFIQHRSSMGNSESAGFSEFRTSDGKTVSPLSNGKFKMDMTGTILTSTDPNAQ